MTYPVNVGRENQGEMAWQKNATKPAVTLPRGLPSSIWGLRGLLKYPQIKAISVDVWPLPDTVSRGKYLLRDGTISASD